ncbi:unnamed protein product [Hydatigera taeniaeformis]|uniref:MAM domain-containing protein n=1 Tax=Hydatigena taeniaeformis TaxID=6205 RepID=A0A0R3X708_HYDTA|nr:unnamed protein product [Hydatigera taeniaeformis]
MSEYLLFLLPFFSSFLLESLSIKPVASCDFNDGETCGWMHEEAVWTHQWEVEQSYLCLKVKTPILPSKKKPSWLLGLATSQRKSSADIRVRFISPPVPSSLGMKCIVFAYSIDGPFCHLGMLSQEDGYFSSKILILRGLLPVLNVRDCLCLRPKILSSSSKKISWLQCLFIDQSGDENDVSAWFSSRPISALLGMKCVTLKYMIGFGKKEFSKPLLASVTKRETSSRLWGPIMASDLGIKCFAIQYAIEGAGHSASLALLQQSSGPFHFFSVEIPPKPFFAWTFNENTGKWVNDAANWHQKWELINGAICLHNVPSEPEESDDNMFWLSLNALSESVAETPKALLWSPPIPQVVGMRCITMNYWIYIVSNISESCRLAMLQQQTG